MARSTAAAAARDRDLNRSQDPPRQVLLNTNTKALQKKANLNPPPSQLAGSLNGQKKFKKAKKRQLVRVKGAPGRLGGGGGRYTGIYD
jgi:hypothetical protein